MNRRGWDIIVKGMLMTHVAQRTSRRLGSLSHSGGFCLVKKRPYFVKWEGPVVILSDVGGTLHNLKRIRT